MKGGRLLESIYHFLVCKFLRRGVWRLCEDEKTGARGLCPGPSHVHRTAHTLVFQFKNWSILFGWFYLLGLNFIYEYWKKKIGGGDWR